MSGNAERMGVYVDGFNLYHGIHDWAGCGYLWLDLVRLAESLRPRNEIVKVHYFTAPVLNNSGAVSRQAIYLKALIDQNPGRLEITNGRYQAREIECRNCHSTHTKYEEKETDVSIAANIVSDAATRAVDSMMIISADSDLLPAVKIAKKLNPELVVVAAFPPNRHSDEMRRALSTFTIGKAKIKAAQLPEIVEGESGVKHRRPAKWAPPVA